MTAVIVERPLTAQQRVLTANNPPPPPPADEDMGHRRRAAANSRGQSVAEVMLGNLVVTNASNCPNTAGDKAVTHTCPSDFLAGPKDSGHVKRGVRRYEDKNECIVAKALTEEWITGRKEGELLQRQQYRQRGPKDNLEGMSCSVKTEEAKQRKLRAPGSAPPHNTHAPYWEEGHEVVSEEKPIHVGKRRFTVQSGADSVGLALWGHDVPQQQKTSTRRNRANESVDVLNLGQYTCKQLNEHERKVLLGPRQISPADLPPRQRCIIARVKSHANETHDVLGTGCGVKEPEVVHRKNPGLSAPRRSNTVNIFEYVQPEPNQKSTHQPSRFLEHVQAESCEKRVPRKSEPATSEPPRQALGKVELGLLFESKSPVIGGRAGRNRGLYAPRTSTTGLLL